MNKEHNLIRFYQRHQNNSLFAVKFRIADSFNNNETLCVRFKIKGLDLYTKINLYGTESRTPFALTNLLCSSSLPEEQSVFISEKLENELLELSDLSGNLYTDKAKQIFNGLFNNVISSIENILKESGVYKQTDYMVV